MCNYIGLYIYTHKGKNSGMKPSIIGCLSCYKYAVCHQTDHRCPFSQWFPRSQTMGKPRAWRYATYKPWARENLKSLVFEVNNVNWEDLLVYWRVHGEYHL